MCLKAGIYEHVMFIYPVLEVRRTLLLSAITFVSRLQIYCCTKQPECLLVRIIFKIYRLEEVFQKDLINDPGGEGLEAKVQQTFLPKQIIFSPT